MSARRACAAIACALILGGYAAPVVAQTRDERAKTLLGLARVKRDAGDADAARRHFEEAASLRPLLPGEREEYFWVVAGRDGKAAIPIGRAILAEAPGRGSVRDRMIGEFVAQGDEASVVALATEGEKLEPGVAVWPRRLGQSALRSRNAEAALAAFERALGRTGSTSEDEQGRQRAAELREETSPQNLQRKELDRARQSGSVRQALAAAEAVAAGADATPADRLAVVELQIQAGDPRAGKSLESWTKKNGCSEQSLSLADRMRDPEGTAVLVKLLETKGCPAEPKWIERGIERTVAVGKHSTARALIARLPAASAAKPAMRRLAGQLALWTGNPAEAIGLLEDVVKNTPADRAARTSLVDAYRAVGRSQDAWKAAEPLLPQAEGSDRLLTYAEIALEAGKPDAVAAIVARVPQSPTVNAARTRLLARAHLATGRPAEAYKLLEGLKPSEFDVPSALALIDSALETSGPAGALASSRRFAADTSAWRDVVARQYLCEAIAGDADRAQAKRSTLASWDPRAVATVDSAVFEATLQKARTRSAAGDHQGVLASFGPASEWEKLPTDARRLVALSLKATGKPRDAMRVFGDTPAVSGDAEMLADLHSIVAREARANGQLDAAYASGERAVALDRTRKDVWVMLAEIAASRGEEALAPLVDRGAPTEAVTAFHMLRAKTYAGSQKFDAALGSIDATLRADANHFEAQRYRADVLSWSGRHAESLAAYDAYLAKQPDDVEAARQQARVYGWIGQFSESKRRYARLLARHPDSAIVTAEAEAKAAYFDGRWSAAAEAYGRWLAIEPENGEAAFERSESLRAAGHVKEADALLKELAGSNRHQLAGPAWERVQMARKPTVSALTDGKSSNGYNGRRLLDLQAAGAGFDATARHGTIATNVQTSYVRLEGGDASRRGYRFGGAMSFDPSASVKIRGRATGWNLDGIGVLPEYMARVDWRPIDRWTLGIGGDRSLVLENIDVVDRQLAATGVFGVARFDSPVASLDVNVGWHELTDDNRRARATVSFDRRLTERLPDLRMLVWAEALSFENSAADYYSPSRQIRLDAGAQYTFEFRALKFRQDFKKRLTFGYLVGTDRDAVVYHHPTVNLTMEFANGLALVMRGDWIRSEVYNERSISLGMTITPGGRR